MHLAFPPSVGLLFNILLAWELHRTALVGLSVDDDKTSDSSRYQKADVVRYVVGLRETLYCFDTRRPKPERHEEGNEMP